MHQGCGARNGAGTSGVISIGKVRDADYYLAETHADDVHHYYAGNERVGVWTGGLAEDLGLASGVEPVDFRSMLNGTNPNTGQDLRATLAKVHSVLFHVAALTGLRRGELCGLRWEDVDIAAAELRVRQAVTTPAGRPIFGPPKSNKSRRTVSLDAGTVDRLLDQQAKIVDMREAATGKWTDSGLVFVNERGGVLDPNNLSKRFAHAVRTDGKGLPHLSIHGLRHTHATHLLAAGVNPKVVSDRLGHHSVAFTLDTYTHVMPGQHAEAADAVAALLAEQAIPVETSGS